jgi:TatD DNase family protein
MLIDTHAHLNFYAFKDDVDEVVRRSLENNTWIINIGSQYTTSKRAVEIAERYSQGVYAAVGLHPIHLADGIFKTKIDKEEIEFETREENFDYEIYKALAQNSKVVAIGEIGLDYYYRPKTKTKLNQFKDLQRTVLCKQLELAKELKLPIIFHCRMAHQDLFEVLKSEIRSTKSEINGVIHCFTGTWEDARKYLKMGFYLGFNGIIFRLNLDDIIKKTPLDKVLIETDCPYLTPSQVSGRNEPLYVKYVAQRIAELKGESFEKVADITTNNAKQLFNLK